MGLSFEIDDKDINLLKRKWGNLSSLYTADETLQDDLFQIIQGKYSEKSRFYHNFSHVKTLLGLFESFADKTRDPQAIQFAIWFHDLIYDTRKSDNEAESARLASEMLDKLRVNMETIGLTRDLILATKDHSGRNLAYDAKLFLDMDLAILGMSTEIYKEYSLAIRQEYSWVSESMYRQGRKKVLKSFVERDKIYFTDEMIARYEAQARKNIISEIKSLEVRKKNGV